MTRVITLSLIHISPENIASDTPSTPTPMPVPSAGAARTATKNVAPEAPTRPTGVTAEDRERAYRIRPGLRQRMEREGLTEDLVRTVLREGTAERVNDWTIRFRHDDYRVDVNTASAELITVVDEYEAECNDGANTTLARGEYTPLNALEMAFSERARVFLSKNPEFVFDIMAVSYTHLDVYKRQPSSWEERENMPSIRSGRAANIRR